MLRNGLFTFLLLWLLANALTINNNNSTLQAAATVATTDPSTQSSTKTTAPASTGTSTSTAVTPTAQTNGTVSDGSSPSADTTNTAQSSGAGGLSTGAIIGICVGAAVFLLICALAWAYKKYHLQKSDTFSQRKHKRFTWSDAPANMRPGA